MTTEPGNEGPQPIEFGVASRRESSGDDRFEAPGSTRARALRGRARRIMPAVLGSVVILAAAFAVSRIPPPEAPPDTSPQKLSGLAHAPDPAPVAVETQEPEDMSAAEKAKKTKEKKRPSARKSPRRVTFSLGGTSLSGSAGAQSGGSTGSAPAPKPADGSGGKKPAKKKTPDKPQATLLLRRAFKEVSGDHFHSVSTSELAGKKQRGYEMKEQIGYLFEEEVPGTRLLAIDEGVMGWLYENDRGSETVPLYRLKGPDYHDYEVVFTSSETVKTRWEGNGWRLDRIEGYLVSP